MTFEEFILLHENDDTAALLLARHRFPDIDIDLAATTIECRRRLRRKVPAWYAVPSLRYPSRLAAEQCSSEETAMVKAMVALSIAAEGCCFQTASASLRPQSVASQPSPPSYAAEGGHGFENNTFLRYSEGDSARIADLTGGMGVDSWAFSQVFGEVLYNEMQSALAEATRQNFQALGVRNVRFCSKCIVPTDYPDKPGNDGVLPQAHDKPGNDGVLPQAHDKPGNDGVLPQAHDKPGNDGVLPQAHDKPGNDGIASLPANGTPSLPANAGNLLEVLDGFKPDVIYMDPARRAEDGRKVFRLADCKPDVLTLLPELLAACPDLLLKLSPMADITQLSRELPGLKAVTVVGADGECKELLLHIRRDYTGPYSLTICENGHTLSFCCNADDAKEGVGYGNVSTPGHGQGEGPVEYELSRSDDEVGNGRGRSGAKRRGVSRNRQPSEASAALLFEPGKALAKTGRFAEIGSRFGLSPIGASTHLYTADSIPEELRPFGKVFEIEEVLPLNNETFRSLKKRIPAAEITARNLPLTSDALRKKLGIASGGTQHLFGVRSDASGNLLLVTTPKAEGE